MGDLKYWDNTYGNGLDSLESQIVAVKRARPTQREELASAATATIRRLQGVRRSYNLEVKLSRDTGLKALYQEEKGLKDARFEELQGKLEEAKKHRAGPRASATANPAAAQAERSALFAGRAPPSSIEMAPYSYAGEGSTASTADAKLNRASQVQDMTEAKYENMITILGQTEEVGVGAAETLEKQRAQIGGITEDVAEMEALLSRGTKLLAVFGKRMATDKFFQCIAFVNVLLLVGIIIYVVITQVGLPGTEPSPPPTPA